MTAIEIALQAAAIGRRLHEQLVITDEDGDMHRCTLAEFIVANRESVGLVAEVLALEPGGSMWDGGGAAPWFSVQRRSPDSARRVAS